MIPSGELAALMGSSTSMWDSVGKAASSEIGRKNAQAALNIELSKEWSGDLEVAIPIVEKLPPKSHSQCICDGNQRYHKYARREDIQNGRIEINPKTTKDEMYLLSDVNRIIRFGSVADEELTKSVRNLFAQFQLKLLFLRLNARSMEISDIILDSFDFM
jgi:hypothetical protein